MALLAVKDLTFTYPLCSHPAIEDITLTVEKGEFLAVCGPTGCGKSTLLRLLKRELAPLGTLTGTITESYAEDAKTALKYMRDRGGTRD